MEARAQIFGNCGRHCHSNHTRFCRARTQNALRGTISEKERCTPCVWFYGGWRKQNMTRMCKPFGKRQRSNCSGNCCSTEQHTESLSDAYWPSARSVRAFAASTTVPGRKQADQATLLMKSDANCCVCLQRGGGNLSATEAKFRNLLAGRDTRQAYHPRILTRGVAWQQLAMLRTNLSSTGRASTRHWCYSDSANNCWLSVP